MKLVLTFLLSCALTGAVLADDVESPTAPSHYISGFLGKSMIMLGSEDVRFGGGLSYAFGRPEKRFQLGQIPAQLVYEGYVDATHSNGANGCSPNSTIAVGGLAYARWRWPLDRHGNSMFFDLGWGLQLADEPTVDLSSDLNSTPVLDIGGIHRAGKLEYLAGLRVLHISNAGTDRPNYGQNELFLMFGVRYR